MSSPIIKGDDRLLAMLPGIARTDTGGDGYDWQSVTVDKSAWIIPASWGLDGWDLGDWPYVQYGYVDVDDTAFGYLSYCEGDITIEVFATAEERDRKLDEAALFHWLHRERDRHLMEGIARRKGKDVHDLTVDDLPPARRGHFSWARLDREKPLTTTPVSDDSDTPTEKE